MSFPPNLPPSHKYHRRQLIGPPGGAKACLATCIWIGSGYTDLSVLYRMNNSRGAEHSPPAFAIATLTEPKSVLGASAVSPSGYRTPRCDITPLHALWHFDISRSYIRTQIMIVQAVRGAASCLIYFDVASSRLQL